MNRTRGPANGFFVLGVCLLFAIQGGSASSGPSPPAGSERSFPRRLVSLAPSITETVLALGASQQLVGVTDFCKLPAEVTWVRRVGGLQNPNIELVVSLKPDLVIMLPGEVAQRKLETHEIPVLVVPNDTMDEIIRSFTAIGAAIGAEARAQELAESVQRKLRDIRSLTENLARPRVLVIVDRNPLFAAGAGTYLDELVTAAGGLNAVPGAGPKYPTLSVEGAISLAPDVIVDSSAAGDPSHENIAKIEEFWAKWPSIPAVKSGRVIVLRSDAMIVPGPRLVEALAEMARIIHPELFGAEALGTPYAR